MPKTKFDKANQSAEVKLEIEENEIKEEIEEVSKDDDSIGEADDDDDDEDIKDEDESSEDDENDDFIKDDDKYDEENKDTETVDEKRPRVISNDVSEGKTVFLKNVPFDVQNEELKACMEQYGPVYYALVCMDPLTEHSKGTAFVKFRVIFFPLSTISYSKILHNQGRLMSRKSGKCE